MKLLNIIYEETFKKSLIKVDNIFDFDLLWLKDIQYGDIIYDNHFDQWKNCLIYLQIIKVLFVHVYQTQKISILLRDIQFYYPHLIILQNFGYYYT